MSRPNLATDGGRIEVRVQAVTGPVERQRRWRCIPERRRPRMRRIGAGPVRNGGEPDAGAAGGSAVARPRGGSGTGGHRVAEGPVEEYLVVAWPAPPAPEQI